LSLIRARQIGPHLIVGDLNTIAPGDRVLQAHNPPQMRRVMAWQFNIIFRLALPRLLRAGYVDCYRRCHPTEDGFTWMPGNLTTRYDYILADPAMAPTLCECDVIDDHPALATASDHLPLRATFAV
jgi:exonuclease III